MNNEAAGRFGSSHVDTTDLVQDALIRHHGKPLIHCLSFLHIFQLNTARDSYQSSSLVVPGR